MNGRPAVLTRPIRLVLRWQLIVTAVLAAVGGVLAGEHGALSAALGGAVSVCASGLSAFVALKRKAASAGDILTGALAAEGVKIGLIVILLSLVFVSYPDVVVGVLVGSFLTTILIFSMAFFVRETE